MEYRNDQNILLSHSPISENFVTYYYMNMVAVVIALIGILQWFNVGEPPE